MPHPNCLRLVAAAALACAAGAAAAQAAPPRGELLYDNHCKGCHTTQLHWRDRRQANDWRGLKGWVARWQGELGLGWSDADIAEVARHLNERFYHHVQTDDRSAALSPR